MDINNMIHMFISPLNLVIIIFGVFVLVEILNKQGKLSEIRQGLEALRNRRRDKISVDADNRVFRTSVSEPVSFDEIIALRKKYDEISPKYYTYVQLISIFPLLGLVGTVMSLIPGIDVNNMEGIASQLGLALTSTLLGLIVSIVLKLIVAFGTSRQVEAIENNLEQLDRELNNAIERSSN